MAKTNVAHLPAKLYELLAPLAPDERSRVVQATLILFGDATDVAAQSIQTKARAGGPGATPNDPGAFFDTKAPQNKGEALAVAARFREIHEKSDTHSKAELRKVITDARRNFDDANFARDINNAKRQAVFFNLGTGRDTSKLSYYGQQFVDALPDRDATAKLNRPRVGGPRKKAAGTPATKK